jgi:hypothetical protein
MYVNMDSEPQRFGGCLQRSERGALMPDHLVDDHDDLQVSKKCVNTFSSLQR